MDNLIFISAVSTSCLTLFYLSYLLLFRKTDDFKRMRLFLILAMITSIILPLHNVEVNISFPKTNSVKISNQVETHVLVSSKEENKIQILPGSGEMIYTRHQWFTVKNIYIVILIIMVFRLFFNLSKIVYFYYSGIRDITGKNTLIGHTKIRHTFSFFRFIFIPEKHGKRIPDQVLKHEKIHASQYHSLDILLIECLLIFMWYNPIVWMMKHTLQQLHEYIADEGVLKTGFDRTQYQALLLNHVAEAGLVNLSSSFNHSLIKKRIVMMSKSKINQNSGTRVFYMVPISLFLFLSIACVNSQNSKKEEQTITAIAMVKSNVLYLGVENPVEIAVSGFKNTDIRAEIDNGVIEGKNGIYLVKPKTPGNAVITVYANDEVVSRSEYKVKPISDPVPTIAGKREGLITKDELLKAGGIKVEFPNTEFELDFEVVSFVMSSSVPGTYTVREEISESSEYSELQLDLINSLIKNQKLMVENIKVKGPDGVVRKVSPMVFLIQ